MDIKDARLAPIATAGVAAELVGMPATTVYSWMRQAHSRRPLMHTVPNERRGWPTISLVGLAEAHTARALRRAHIPMSAVVRFAERLREDNGSEYAFATPKLVTDGIDVFISEDEELTRLNDGQKAIRKVVERYLTELIPWDDGLTGAYRPPRLASKLVEIDPRFNAGRMSFRRNRVPLFAVAGSISAGDSPRSVGESYGLTEDEVALVESNLDWLEKVA